MEYINSVRMHLDNARKGDHSFNVSDDPMKSMRIVEEAPEIIHEDAPISDNKNLPLYDFDYNDDEEDSTSSNDALLAYDESELGFDPAPSDSNNDIFSSDAITTSDDIDASSDDSQSHAINKSMTITEMLDSLMAIRKVYGNKKCLIGSSPITSVKVVNGTVHIG